MAFTPDPVVLHQPLASTLCDVAPARSTRPLALWHLLSLDAPTVATLWTWFAARCFHISLSLYELAGMFLAVWMLYAADRLLDSHPLHHSVPHRRLPAKLEPRHFFHARHRRAFLGGIVAAAGGLGICIARFPHAELAMYALLGALLTAWFAIIHTVAPQHATKLPKEIAVGLFFSAAIFLPTAMHRSSGWHALLPPAFFFGLLCAINGLFIHLWERSDSNPPSRHQSVASAPIEFLLAHLSELTLLCCLIPLGIALLDRTAVAPIYLAVSLSAAALVALHRSRHNFSPTSLRALADAVLLSPLLLALFLR